MFRLFILWIKRESSHLLWIKTLVKWKVTNLWRGWFGRYNLVGELEKQWKKIPKIAICWEAPLQLSSTPFLHFPQTTTWISPHSFPSHINKMTLSALHLFRSLNIFLLQIIHTHTPRVMEQYSFWLLISCINKGLISFQKSSHILTVFEAAIFLVLIKFINYPHVAIIIVFLLSKSSNYERYLVLFGHLSLTKSETLSE